MRPWGQGVIFAQVVENDTAAVNLLLGVRAVKDLVPRGISFLYTSAPVGETADGFEIYNLLGVRDEIELTGDVITDARVDFDQLTNVPEVSMTMNSEGAKIGRASCRERV